MDLSKYDFDSGDLGSHLEPGTYTLEYVSDEEIQGRNGWVALKVQFKCVEQPCLVYHTFTVEHDTSEAAVSIGLQSLANLGKAMGFDKIKDTSELVGSSVRANLVKDEKGYLVIDDGKGKGWQKAKSAPVKKEEAKDNGVSPEADEEIPF